MAASNPPTRGEAIDFDVTLEDWANPGRMKLNPTLAAGDVKIVKDNGAAANLNTLPSVAPAGGYVVDGILSATEMDADKVTVYFHDQTEPPEWGDHSFTILTSAP